MIVVEINSYKGLCYASHCSKFFMFYCNLQITPWDGSFNSHLTDEETEAQGQ